MFCDIVTSAAVLWTCSSLVGSRCFRPSRTVTGESAARTDTRCSAGRRCATAGPQPIGRSGRTAARHSRRTSLAPGWTRLSEPDTDRHISLVLEYFHSTCTRVKTYIIYSSSVLHHRRAAAQLRPFGLVTKVTAVQQVLEGSVVWRHHDCPEEAEVVIIGPLVNHRPH